MNNESAFRRFIGKNPHSHVPFLHGLMAAGVTSSASSRRCHGQLPGLRLPAGAGRQRSIRADEEHREERHFHPALRSDPSHIDTFDLKMTNGITPSTFNPTDLKGVAWNPVSFRNSPPSLRTSLWFALPAPGRPARVGQTGVQIGRSPAAVLGDVAPNMGSIVSIEKKAERTASQIFPTFLALNSAGAIGAGYLPANYEPFKMAPSAAGLPNTTNVDGPIRLAAKYDLLQSLDNPLRVNSPYGDPMTDFGAFYQAARGLMYNPAVDKAFRFSTADSVRYGTTAFGNALLTAKQVLEANMGTRYVQVTLGGWDMHNNIYTTAAGQNSIFSLGKMVDDALSTLIADLKSNGQLNETLIVDDGRIRPHGRPALCHRRSRSLPPAIRLLRRRRRKGRSAIGPRIPPARVRRVRLVRGPRRACRRRRSHHLFRPRH